MSESIHHKVKLLTPGVRASIYYLMMWGMLSMYATYIGIDFIQRGVTGTQWGVISAIRALTVFLIAPQITRLADQHRARITYLRWLLILSAFVLLLFPYPKQFMGFVLVSVLSAFFTASVNPMSDGIIVRMTKKHDLEYGRLRLWGSLGFAVFGTAAGFVWNLVGYNWIYYAGFIGLLLSAALTTLLEEPEDEPEQPQPEPVRPIVGAAALPKNKNKVFAMLLADVVLLLFFLAALFRASSELMYFSFSSIYVQSLTNNGFFTGLVINGAALLEIPVMLFSQKIIRRFSLESVIIFGFFVQLVGTVLFAFTVSPWLLFLGSALRNAGFAFYFVAAVQFVDQRSAPGYATTYQGFLSSISWGLAPLIVSPLAGVIYEKLGAQWVFIFGAILSAFSVAIMVPVIVKLRLEKKNQQLAAE